MHGVTFPRRDDILRDVFKRMLDKMVLLRDLLGVTSKLREGVAI